MKLLISILFLIPIYSWAQEPVVVEKKIVCNWVSVILGTLKETYKEEPVWVGIDKDRSRYGLFVNPKNGHFTLVQFNNEIACILGAGESSFNLPTKPTL